MPEEVTISYLGHTETRTVEEAVKVCSDPDTAPYIMGVVAADKATENRLNDLLDATS